MSVNTFFISSNVMLPALYYDYKILSILNSLIYNFPPNVILNYNVS